MINILIVCAHPEKKSFTHALKDSAIEEIHSLGFNVEVSDLYELEFNPVAGRQDFLEIENNDYFHYQSEQLNASHLDLFEESIKREQLKLMNCDLLILVFPLWWGGMPAIMKGWFDKVLAYGIAYADGKRFDEGFFVGRRGVLGITTGGTNKRFSEDDVYGPIEDLILPINRCMLEYIGLETFAPFVAYATPRVDNDTRKEYLVQWRKKINTILMDKQWLESLNQLEPVKVTAHLNRNNNWGKL